VVDNQPQTIDLTFAKESEDKLRRSIRSTGINPMRWERIRTEVRFDDVVADLLGESGGNSIRCPFHGRDSTPSFNLYRGTNDGWCFGCPPGEQYYDSVLLVSRFNDITRVAAMQWLEKKWNLPPIADIENEEEEREILVEIGFDDLVEPYVFKVARHLDSSQDVELAEDYMRIFFEAWNLNQSGIKKAKEPADSEEERETLIDEANALKTKATIGLARVLGKDVLDRVQLEKTLRI
jgi:hypothetical protein